MRRVFLLLMAALPICATQARAAPECAERDLAVTVQIHDYVHLPGERLSRAMEIVTRLYETIGVRIDWLGVLQRDTRRVRSAIDEKTPRVPVAQITVIILTPAMAARGRIPDGVLGFAAVPVEGGMGRIAYVIYDRVQTSSSRKGASMRSRCWGSSWPTRQAICFSAAVRGRGQAS